MRRYIIRRVLAIFPLLLFATAFSFILGQYGAGDLAAYLTMREGGGQINLDRYYEIREILHLDDPVIVRYGRWLWNALQGDLGTSWVSVGSPKVTDMILIAIPNLFTTGAGGPVIPAGALYSAGRSSGGDAQLYPRSPHRSRSNPDFLYSRFCPRTPVHDLSGR
ncbi:hypothetical protein KFU94_39130 [Chloroflexi bacterium TSY]|nr:hypothetical protein [Chloroflexi bacterium TSY]